MNCSRNIKIIGNGNVVHIDSSKLDFDVNCDIYDNMESWKTIFIIIICTCIALCLCCCLRYYQRRNKTTFIYKANLEKNCADNIDNC